MKKFYKGIMVLSVGMLLAGCSCNNHVDEPEIEQTQTEEGNANTDFSDGKVNLYNEAVKSTVRVEAGSQLGSGVVFFEESGRAYILTNAHVLTDRAGNKHYESGIEVTFSNYVKVNATFIGLDRNEDVAVISVQASDNYTKAKIIENDGDVKVGEQVFSIGNPYGIYFSVTDGIISSNRIKTTTDYISGTSETKTYVYNSTATINPGNSGGPMFNSKGEVIAINSMQPNTSNEELRNFNYSIPINHFIKVANYIVNNASNENTKNYTRAKLNLTVESICSYSVNELSTLGITVKRGVYIVDSNETLISKGRIITQINGVDISTLEDYEFELLKYSKNQSITVVTTDIVGTNSRTVNVVLR